MELYSGEGESEGRGLRHGLNFTYARCEGSDAAKRERLDQLCTSPDQAIIFRAHCSALGDGEQLRDHFTKAYSLTYGGVLCELLWVRVHVVMVVESRCVSEVTCMLW